MGKNGKERNEAEIKAQMRGEGLDQSRGWRGRLALTEASLWCPVGNIAATWQTVIIITPQHDNCCVRGHCYTLLHPILSGVWWSAQQLSGAHYSLATATISSIVRG